MRDDSFCSKDILCQFEKSRSLSDALIEICIKCGKKVVYQKVDGRIDDKRYLLNHKRDTIQPFGKHANLFLKIYGNRAIKTIGRARDRFRDKKIMEEERRKVREKRLWMRKQAFKGEGKTEKQLEQELNRFKFKTTGLQNVSNH